MKSLRILIASSFLLTACSLSPQEEPMTSTEPLSDASNEETTRANLFLVDLEDNGANGALIGCGDSLVSRPTVVSRAFPEKDAIQALLDLPKEDPETGFYNALAQANLKVDGMELSEERSVLYLSGDIVLGGMCDAPRVEEQLKATFFQGEGPGFIYLNDVLLHDALSSK